MSLSLSFFQTLLGAERTKSSRDEDASTAIQQALKAQQYNRLLEGEITVRTQLGKSSQSRVFRYRTIVGPEPTRFFCEATLREDAYKMPQELLVTGDGTTVVYRNKTMSVAYTLPVSKLSPTTLVPFGILPLSESSTDDDDELFMLNFSKIFKQATLPEGTFSRSAQGGHRVALTVGGKDSEAMLRLSLGLDASNRYLEELDISVHRAADALVFEFKNKVMRSSAAPPLPPAPLLSPQPQPVDSLPHLLPLPQPHTLIQERQAPPRTAPFAAFTHALYADLANKAIEGRLTIQTTDRGRSKTFHFDYRTIIGETLESARTEGTYRREGSPNALNFQIIKNDDQITFHDRKNNIYCTEERSTAENSALFSSFIEIIYYTLYTEASKNIIYYNKLSEKEIQKRLNEELSRYMTYKKLDIAPVPANKAETLSEFLLSYQLSDEKKSGTQRLRLSPDGNYFCFSQLEVQYNPERKAVFTDQILSFTKVSGRTSFVFDPPAGSRKVDTLPPFLDSL